MKISARPLALIEALPVSLMWASSPVLMKIGAVHGLGMLTQTGIRYFGGFLFLLPFLAARRDTAQNITKPIWIRLLGLGVVAYTIGYGAAYTGLNYTPATTFTFVMSIAPFMVLIFSIIWLREMPTRWQIVGVFVAIAGSALFFSPGLQPGEPLGIALAGVGMMGPALLALVGREIARQRQIDTVYLAAIPLGFGGGILLVVALLIEGLPPFSWTGLFVVLWLAIVNTSLALYLYNHALKELRAFEQSVLFNLTPFGTALFSWLLLGDILAPIQFLGMAVVIVGILFVQKVLVK
jgi:probable blue pigment (indigoidine) exporter